VLTLGTYVEHCHIKGGPSNLKITAMLVLPDLEIYFESNTLRLALEFASSKSTGLCVCFYFKWLGLQFHFAKKLGF
jgi:hypothetical protein